MTKASLLFAVLLNFSTGGTVTGTVTGAVPTPQTSIADRVSGFSVDTARGRSDEAQLSWQQRVRREGDQRVIEMTIVNHGNQRRCIAVEHRFRFKGLDHRPFVASAESHPAWPEDGQIACAYVREDRNWMHLGIPFTSLRALDGETGTSFSADLGNMPILPFEVRMWHHENENATFVSIRRPQVHLEPNASNVVSLVFLAFGSGLTMSPKPFEDTSEMNVKTIRHTGIVVSDMERSLAFYRDLLGMEVWVDFQDDSDYVQAVTEVPGANLWMVKLKAADDNTSIELLQYLSHPGEIPPATRASDVGCNHVCLHVDDIDATYEHLTAHGIRFHAPPTVSSDGGAKATYCRDPEGVIVELVQLLK